jgi:putative phosphoesterase
MSRRSEVRAGTDRRAVVQRIGVISDTHGRLDPSILVAFSDVAHIIHAGDIGKRSILRKLEAVAPVTAVSGNTDVGKLAKELPTQTTGEAAGVRFLVAHKPKQLRRSLRRGAPEGVRLVVTGHLHEPQVGWEDGVLHLNPGTASSPEEGDPSPTVAVVTVVGGYLTATFVPVGATAGKRPVGRADRGGDQELGPPRPIGRPNHQVRETEPPSSRDRTTRLG